MMARTRVTRSAPSMRGMALSGVAALIGAAALVGASGLAVPPDNRDAARTAGHFADAADDRLVIHGKQVYAQHCAACHGRSLQGQPLWQLNDEFAGRRAPAHDQTGHTWQHSDEDLFRMTKYGSFDAGAGGDAPVHKSSMPAFGGILDDADILAGLAFIKRSWPLGLRISQAMLNPDQRGMPANAAGVEWRLPPTTCRGVKIARTAPK